MALCRHHLPRFRATCLGIGGLFVLLGASQLAQGIPAAMAGFGIPDVVLASAHYQDAMAWVFVHLLMKGLTIATMGYFLEGARSQRAFARLMVVSVAVFTAMDLHTSDSVIGNGLYGVDLKQSGRDVYVIEVNDNPNIDGGFEDSILREDLYRRILEVFLERIEANKAGVGRG